MSGEVETIGSGRARALAPLRLDVLAKALAGTERKGSFEALLTANAGLAGGGPYVAEGRVVIAPERPPAEQTVATVNPWD